MPTLNGILVDHFLQPLLGIARSAWTSISVIDCLNYATMYPQFFTRVANDPTVYYVFVVRGMFTAVPDKKRKPFGTTCPGVSEIRQQNVMVISVCSSYMFSIKINTTPRCSFDCKVSEGLFNLWSLSSGKGLPEKQRIPRALSSVDQIAEDACQLDDIIIGVVAALLSRQGARVEIFSTDSRFFGETLELPTIRYPFYMVVHTHGHRVGIPVYQRDSRILDQELQGTANPAYVVPYEDAAQPLWSRRVNTKSKMEKKLNDWRKSKSPTPVPQAAKQDVTRRFLESPVDGLEESSYSNPVTPEQHSFIQREAFDSIEDGHDPACGYITETPTLQRISREELERLASFRDVVAAPAASRPRRSRRR